MTTHTGNANDRMRTYRFDFGCTLTNERTYGLTDNTKTKAKSSTHTLGIDCG